MLHDGDVIIFPTDTVYGIGTRLGDKKGLKKIYEIKQRPITKKIPVLVSNFVDINQIAKYTERDFTIMKHFWPGNVTLILNSTASFYKKVGEQTIAIRIPNNSVATEILDNYGPMWVTSVNNSGEPAINDYSVIKEKYGTIVQNIIPPNESISSGVSSTIIDLTTDQIKIVRQGDVTIDMINSLLKSR